MLPEKLKKTLEKQHYGIAGRHSAVQVCRWNKKSLTDQGDCYKNKFYGIKSYACAQMSPSAGFCQNRCLHCWRAIELTIDDKMPKDVDEPEKIIEEVIRVQKKLITGFKGNSKINKKKFEEAQDPKHFAISLTGEPTLYPKLPKLVKLLRKKSKTTFIVSNGLNPLMIKRLEKENALPTQLYISMNSSNEKDFIKWQRTTTKNPWKTYKKSLKLLGTLNDKTRTVLRMTLVKGKNDNMSENHAKEFADLIKLANPHFIEVKGFVSVGFARKRKDMGYDTMPNHEEIKEFGKTMLTYLKAEKYKILDEYIPSKIVLLGQNKKNMKIKKKDI